MNHPDLINAVQIAKELRREFNLTGIGTTLSEFILKLGEKYSVDFSIIDFDFKQSEELKDVSGAIISEKSDGKVIILTQETESNFRKRFTVAHELGHFVLHNDYINFMYDKYANIENYEIDDIREGAANAFAAELLMPEDQIIKLYSAFEHDIEKLTRAFGVTKKALELRMKTLKIQGVL